MKKTLKFKSKEKANYACITEHFTPLHEITRYWTDQGSIHGLHVPHSNNTPDEAGLIMIYPHPSDA